MHKNQPKQESNEAILARIKKEMDEPRVAESTRKELRRQPHHAAGTGKAAVKSSERARRKGNAPDEENSGKASQTSP
jgi:hypothetical protein